MEDGTSYRGREGGTLTVEDDHAPYIRRQVGGDAGLTGYGANRTFLGTKGGRFCMTCAFLAQSWSVLCPRCESRGIESYTIPEAEMPARPPSRMPSACLVPISPAPSAAP